MKFVTFLLAFLLVVSAAINGAVEARSFRGERPCDEIYVVKEGETLQTISVKCKTLSILDDNPQILDSDDLGQGTVLYIRRPAKGGRL
ncbi:hypothetical protein MA16_Dca004463 [Dendrobium catenatum]|uniref:LysM domain-containing protein n=1 Tax=Dendrobium catenatum TaxID=906689 RepID=A0A2I0W7J9_9ASPA|nr:hypothetical protein MA16_Dca004463 [Dendrobium catenatum]